MNTLNLLMIAVIALLVVASFVTILRRVSQSNQVEIAPYGVDFGEFSMPIVDVFSIKGRGLVVTGRVESGRLTIGQKVVIKSAEGQTLHETTVVGIEQFRKKVDSAEAGENVGVLLKNLTKDDVQSGMILTQAD